MLRITKAFWTEGYQAVRLPREFWFDSDVVRIERRGGLILLTPISRAPAWSAERPGPFLRDGLGDKARREGRRLSQAQIDAEVLRIFGQRPANDNELAASLEAPVE